MEYLWSHTPEEAVIPQIIASAIFFTIFYKSSGWISEAKSRTYREYFNAREKVDWNNRTVSIVHSFVVVPAAFYCLFVENMWHQDQVYFHTHASRLLCCFSAGYFVWDLVTCAANLKFFGPSFLIHGIYCTFVYVSVSMPSPMFQRLAVCFLLFEISTIFLNFGDIANKLKKYPIHAKSSSLGQIQTINFGLFALAFLIVRLGFGNYCLYDLIIMGYTRFNEFSLWRQISMVTYIVMCCVSSVVNTYWFYKIILKGYRMLSGKDKEDSTSDRKNKSDEIANGKLNAVTTKNDYKQRLRPRKPAVQSPDLLRS
jgi:hypothetical protein